MKKLVLVIMALFAFLMSGCTTSACVSTNTSASATCNCGGETKTLSHCSAYNHNGRCVAW